MKQHSNESNEQNGKDETGMKVMNRMEKMKQEWK